MVYSSKRIWGIVDMIIGIEEDDFGNINYYSHSTSIDFERLFSILIGEGAVYEI